MTMQICVYGGVHAVEFKTDRFTQTTLFIVERICVPYINCMANSVTPTVDQNYNRMLPNYIGIWVVERHPIISGLDTGLCCFCDN